MRLEELRGVGPQLAAALRRHFRGDEAVLEAARRLDVRALSAVDGVSERRALGWIRQVRGQGGGDTLLATPAARRLHDGILERIQAFAATEHGRNRIRLLAPLADPAAAEAHAREVMAHRDRVAAMDREQTLRLLRRLRRPAEPAPRIVADRILVCGEGAALERLRALGVPGWVPVAGPEEVRRGGGAGLVLVADVRLDASELDGTLEVDPAGSLAELAPEAVLAWFEANRPLLESVAGLGRLVGRPQKAAEALALLGEASRLEASPARLRAAVARVQDELERDLRERLAGLQVRGDQVLEALGERLPGPLQKVVEAALRDARARLRERTGFDLQPFLPGLPVRLDEAEVERVERRLEAVGHQRLYESRVRLARRLAALQDEVRQEVAAWMDFDAPFALGCFALHHGLAPARFGDELRFEDSVHLDLSDRPGAQRIAYQLGGPVRAVLLTGANSGGKTTLLEHLGQLALMARMGLPVVGRGVVVPWVEELWYVTARKGLDAGAFETFLRTFLPAAEGGAGRLVLADEVEAVTELEAAGRILAFFLERAARAGTLAVVATHMAPLVLSHAAPPPGSLRVDGIEASGLDARGRLVVDRAPRMGHLARSTPELIVQRLALAARGADQGLFRDLLGRLQAGRKGQTKAAASPPP